MSTFLKRQQVRRERAFKKALRRLQKIFSAVAIMTVGLACVYGFYLLLFFTPFLSIREIAVEGVRQVSAEEIVRLSGVSIGENLLGIDVSDVHQRLQVNPWIKMASVRRHPPHELIIHIVEYEPAAILVKEPLSYVDREGQIFKEVSVTDNKNYPVFTGMIDEHDAEEEEKEDKLSTSAKERVMNGFRLLDWYSQANFDKSGTVSEINYNAMRGFSIVSQENPMRIVVGEHAIDDQLKILTRFRDAIREKNHQILYIIAYDKNQVVVRYKPLEGKLF
ncbi:MAG: FtsQ-type POTRA domain-containing protein [Deltaproteobacteria bacterium]|nr:FtsQ-type POTRA domain-containing protein [Deltaproteobacteria bacterium]